MQSKPSAAELPDRHPGVDGHFYMSALGNKGVSCFKSIYTGCGLGGWDKVNLAQFCDRLRVPKEEVFTAFYWVRATVLKSMPTYTQGYGRFLVSTPPTIHRLTTLSLSPLLQPSVIQFRTSQKVILVVPCLPSEGLGRASRLSPSDFRLVRGEGWNWSMPRCVSLAPHLTSLSLAFFPAQDAAINTFVEVVVKIK